VPRLQVQLLGSFSVRCEGEELSLCASAQRVVAFLALERRPLRREFVAGSLWPDSSDARASAALRTALWRAGGGDVGLVTLGGRTIGLDPGAEVDTDAFATLAKGVLRDPGACAIALAERLADPAELLPDWYEEWVVVEREWLRQLRTQALEALADALIARRDYRGAVRCGLAAVATDALRESAHRVVIRAHLAEGNHGDALRQYRLCADLVRRGLGIDPSPATASLVALHRAC